MPAASGPWLTSRACVRTRSSTMPCPCSSTSSTAAAWALSPTPVTARASSSRYRTASFARRRRNAEASFPTRGNMVSPCSFCPRMPKGSPRACASSRTVARPRASRCCSGATFPSTAVTWARRRSNACPSSSRRSWGVPRASRPATISSASSTSAVAPSRSAHAKRRRSTARSSTSAR